MKVKYRLKQCYMVMVVKETYSPVWTYIVPPTASHSQIVPTSFQSSNENFESSISASMSHPLSLPHCYPPNYSTCPKPTTKVKVHHPWQPHIAWSVQSSFFVQQYNHWFDWAAASLGVYRISSCPWWHRCTRS